MNLTKNQLQKIIREELGKLRRLQEKDGKESLPGKDAAPRWHSAAQRRRHRRQATTMSFERFKKKVWNLVDDDLWAHRHHQFEADPLLRHFWEISISSKDPGTLKDVAEHYNEMSEDEIENQYGPSDAMYDDGDPDLFGWH